MRRNAGDAATLSRFNPLVARIRLLSRSPEERARARLMLAEGVHLAMEALAEGSRILEAIVSPRLDADARAPSILSGLRDAGVRVRRATDALLASVHEAESHQGILLVVRRPEASLGDLTPSGGARALVLIPCGVQDPGNMGALVRLADAAGATGLLAAGGADPFGPKAARASAGSIFRLRVARVRGAPEALEFAAGLRRGGALVAGAVSAGGTPYRQADLSAPLALFLGGEGAGLPDDVTRALDLRITIPVNPRVESLNVAAAAAILLFEASRLDEATTPRGPDRPRAAAPRRPVPGAPPRPGPAGPGGRRG